MSPLGLYGIRLSLNLLSRRQKKTTQSGLYRAFVTLPSVLFVSSADD
jgi:hypothetical protein